MTLPFRSALLFLSRCASGEGLLGRELGKTFTRARTARSRPRRRLGRVRCLERLCPAPRRVRRWRPEFANSACLQPMFLGPEQSARIAIPYHDLPDRTLRVVFPANATSLYAAAGGDIVVIEHDVIDPDSRSLGCLGFSHVLSPCRRFGTQDAGALGAIE